MKSNNVDSKGNFFFFFLSRRGLKVERYSWSPWKFLFARFEFNRCQLSLTALRLNWHLPAGTCSPPAATSPSRDLATTGTCKAVSLGLTTWLHSCKVSSDIMLNKATFHTCPSRAPIQMVNKAGGDNVVDSYSLIAQNLFDCQWWPGSGSWAFLSLTSD